jgi:hypothetical protein
MPCLLDTYKAIFGKKTAEKMRQIHPYQMIRLRDVSQWWMKILIRMFYKRQKNKKIISLHLDESTDIANKTLLHIDILTGTVKWLQKISWTSLLATTYYWKVKKAKAILVPERERPYGCETSRLPHFLDNRLTDGGEVVSLTRRPPFTLRKIPGTHFCWRLSRPPGPECDWKG